MSEFCPECGSKISSSSYRSLDPKLIHLCDKIVKHILTFDVESQEGLSHNISEQFISFSVSCSVRAERMRKESK